MTAAGNVAICPSGTYALGGGGTTNPPNPLTSSAPVFDSAGHSIGWSISQTGGVTAGLATYVICATATTGAQSPPPPPPPPIATAIRCSASRTTMPADFGATITTVSGTLVDAGGNVVTNDYSTPIFYTNNTPTIIVDRNSTQPSPRTAQGGVATKDYIALLSGTGSITLSSGTLTGCTQSITVTSPGPATALATFVYLGTISADGVSKSIVEVDVTDANGVIVSTDNSSQISISRTSGAAVCNSGGLGSAGPTLVSAGSAYFTLTSTSIAGTCGWTATSNMAGISSANATLVTVASSAPSQLAIQGNASPKAADGTATLRVTVALRDASGSPVTTPASQVAVTASLGAGCSGTKPDGSTGSVTFSNGSVTNQIANTGSYSAYNGVNGNTASSATSTNYARFVFKSTFATPGCLVTFSDGSASPTTATILFTAAGPANIACSFSPNKILDDGSSTSNATVSMVDNQGNRATQGAFSVSFARTSGTANTTLVTTSPQVTSNGFATFTVQANTTAGVQVDTYSAQTIVSGVTKSGTCTITTQPTLP